MDNTDAPHELNFANLNSELAKVNQLINLVYSRMTSYCIEPELYNQLLTEYQRSHGFWKMFGSYSRVGYLHDKLADMPGWLHTRATEWDTFTDSGYAGRIHREIWETLVNRKLRKKWKPSDLATLTSELAWKIGDRGIRPAASVSVTHTGHRAWKLSDDSIRSVDSVVIMLNCMSMYAMLSLEEAMCMSDRYIDFNGLLMQRHRIKNSLELTNKR